MDFCHTKDQSMNTVNQPIRDTSVLYLGHSSRGACKTEVPRIAGGEQQKCVCGNTMVTYSLPNSKDGGQMPPMHAQAPKCTPAHTLMYLHAALQLFFHCACYLKFYSLVSWFLFLLTFLLHLLNEA